MDTKSRVLSNLIWRFLERCGAQLVTFIVSIVLARLLSPSEYGQIALITVFITILNVFIDGGFGNALIQKKDADELDFSSVFYFNIVVCLLMYALLFLAAPLLASFYGDPIYISLTRVIGLTIVISGVKNIQQAYVSKHLLFKKFFFSTLFGTITSAIIGIVMAYMGFGVWAIVFQHLTNAVIDTLILWCTVKWRPTQHFNLERIKILFSYGYKLLLSSLMNTFYNEFRQLVIGKVYPSSDLALYNKGKQFPALVINNINTSIDSVLFPVMAEKQDDRNDVKNMIKQSITFSSFILWPLLVGLAVVAKPLLLLMLTEKWIGAIPFLQIFCVMYMTHPIQTANLNALKAIGKSDAFLKLEIIETIFAIVILIPALYLGVIFIALVSVIASLFNVWLISRETKKYFDYGLINQIKDIFPNIVLCLIMGILSYLPSFFFINNWVIVIQMIVGIATYIISAMVTKNESFGIFLNYMKKLVKR